MTWYIDFNLIDTTLIVVFFVLIFIGILLTLLQFVVQFKRPHYTTIDNETSTQSKDDIYLSIHIPTRAEPFQIVQNCIDSIANQISSNDEIIIIDNNHNNKANYEQLESYCTKKGIQFIHVDYVSGFKAGAMNLSLSYTSKQAEYIVILDCDYIVKPKGIDYIKQCIVNNVNFSFLQFPQSYIYNSKLSVDLEFGKYFDYNLNLPLNRYNSLGTGSLCVVNKKELIKINGWPTNSITEDAQFGIDIQKNGGRGLYVPKVIGKGVLPQSIKDYINQRKRWTFGNAQVLIDYIFNNINLSFASNFSQLSTWLNFTFLTIVIHVLTLLLILLNFDLHIVLVVVYIHYLIVLTFRLYEFLQLNDSTLSKMKALMIHWNFFWISSVHWIPALWGIQREFVKTPKIKLIKSSVFNLPKCFLLLNIATLPIIYSSVHLVLFCLFFILIDLLSKRILLNNYKI